MIAQEYLSSCWAGCGTAGLTASVGSTGMGTAGSGAWDVDVFAAQVFRLICTGCGEGAEEGVPLGG